MIKVAVTDDHMLMRKGISNALKSNIDFDVIVEAENGQILIDFLNEGNLPDIVLLDVQMPVMDGYATLDYLHFHYPAIKVIMLSMIQDPLASNNLLRRGASQFLSKATSADELIDAVIAVYKNQDVDEDIDEIIEEEDLILNEKEMELLRYCPTPLTYDQIAEAMLSTTKTLDRYRIELFRKLNVQSRAELAAIAVKMGLVV